MTVTAWRATVNGAISSALIRFGRSMFRIWLGHHKARTNLSNDGGADVGDVNHEISYEPIRFPASL